MDQWIQSCEDFQTYPQNLTHHNVLEHSIKAHQDRLAAPTKCLFDEDDAALDFFDLSCLDTGTYSYPLPMRRHKPRMFRSSPVTEFQSKRIVTTNGLKQHLRASLVSGKTDPRCRFV